MECAICQVRSSVGYCAECQTLLCDECGITCQKCGKLVCSKHVYETRSHKRLCGECMEERKARAAERVAAAEEDTSLEGLDAAVPEEVSEEALVASARKPPPPWKLSAVTAGAGVVIMLVLLAFPHLRQVELSSGGTALPTPYLLMFIPALALLWGVIGLVGPSYQADRAKAFIGLALSIVCIVLAVVAVQTDPARRAAAEAQAAAQQLRNATPEQIKEKRESVLNKFK